MAKKKPARKAEAAKSKSPVPEEADEQGAPPEDAAQNDFDFTIVGVGASAGGLEAFTQLLQALPSKPGLALIFVQHLAPKHASALPTLLSGATSLPVLQVTEGIEVAENHVYVIPPNVQMELRGRQLHLGVRPE